jgi:hypothetical protein
MGYAIKINTDSLCTQIYAIVQNPQFDGCIAEPAPSAVYLGPHTTERPSYSSIFTTLNFHSLCPIAIGVGLPLLSAAFS